MTDKTYTDEGRLAEEDGANVSTLTPVPHEPERIPRDLHGLEDLATISLIKGLGSFFRTIGQNILDHFDEE